MEHTSAVGVRDRVADVDEPSQKLSKGQGALRRVAPGLAIGTVEALHSLLQALAADEPHGVERPAVIVGPQTVNGHDPGMLEPPGNLGFDQEAGPAGRVIGMLRLDLLEGDLAVELAIQSHKHHPDATSCVVPQQVEAAPLRGCLAQAEAPIKGILSDVSIAHPDGKIARIARTTIAQGRAPVRKSCSSRSGQAA